MSSLRCFHRPVTPLLLSRPPTTACVTAWTQTVLSPFVATFLYGLLVLRTIRGVHHGECVPRPRNAPSAATSGPWGGVLANRYAPGPGN